MRIIHSLETARPERDVVLTIGTFDGVHRGINSAGAGRSTRAGRPSERRTVVSPHPRTVLHPDISMTYLSTPQERADLMERLGLDLFVLLPFTLEFAATPAEPLVRSLVQQLRMRELWVGTDFAMAHQREANVERLRELGGMLGYDLHTIEPLTDADRAISSTRIRALLAEGRVEQAAFLLGRYYSVPGRVVHGAGRGRSLGFRTANVAPPADRLMPANGIYAVWMLIDGARYAGAANVGVRPSFDNGERLLEVHLLDYEGDLYDRQVSTEFVQYIREERRYDNVEALRRQVARDVEEIRALLGVTRIPEGADGSGRFSTV